jgi:YVTN family beta-propeller protein
MGLSSVFVIIPPPCRLAHRANDGLPAGVDVHMLDGNFLLALPAITLQCLVTNSVAVIDTATNRVVATVPVGSGPWEPAVTPDGKHVYVTNFGTGNDPAIASNVSVIDTATNTVVATVPVGNEPFGVAITPDGHAYDESR